MGPIRVTASDKDWLLDALLQLLQAPTPRLWNWEMIICEAQQSTFASSTITQHVYLAMSALHEQRMLGIQRRKEKIRRTRIQERNLMKKT